MKYEKENTPYSRVLVEELTGYQVVEKYPALCGAQIFITAVTSALHLSLS